MILYNLKDAKIILIKFDIFKIYKKIILLIKYKKL